MKKIIYIAILFSSIVLPLSAQNNIEEVLSSIEQHNTTLKAFREQANADKIGNKTGINLENPEVEFGYSWGSPASEGRTKELNVTQNFNFPTAYRYKSQLTDGQNLKVDLLYEQQVKEILQEARAFCLELVYQNILNKELAQRTKEAKELAVSYQTLFDKGEINVIEYNKTRLNLLNMEKALQMNEVEISTLEAELQRLNGEESVSGMLNNYSEFGLPLSFDEWFERIKENNPILRTAEKEIELSRKQEQLTRALNLPKFSAGYISERVLGTTMQGFKIGVSIPLWEGRNTVKHQKAQTVALRVQKEDSKFQFKNDLRKQYQKATKLNFMLKEYKDVLKVSNDQILLKKALDQGQLSLINYLLELEVYYGVVDQYMSTEKEYQIAVSELQQWD